MKCLLASTPLMRPSCACMHCSVTIMRDMHIRCYTAHTFCYQASLWFLIAWYVHVPFVYVCVDGRLVRLGQSLLTPCAEKYYSMIDIDLYSMLLLATTWKRAHVFEYHARNSSISPREKGMPSRTWPDTSACHRDIANDSACSRQLSSYRVTC